MRSSSTLANLDKVDTKVCSKHANLTSRSFMKGAAVKTMEKPSNPALMDFVKREPNKTFIIQSYRQQPGRLVNRDSSDSDSDTEQASRPSTNPDPPQ